MRIALSGSQGLIGSALRRTLIAHGHELIPIRRDGGPGIAWDGGTHFDAESLRQCEAIIHLAGASVARRWTARVRREIHDSRVRSTRALAEILADGPGKARVLIIASAIGWYGDRDDEILDEDSGPGTGFLASVCQAWEAAADPCRAHVRTVHLRFGMVLAPDGGALPRLIAPLRWGLGGRLGSGQQWWSWIALDDAVRIAHGALADERWAGPINVVAPQPLRQCEFVRRLAAALRRPLWGPAAPAWALRALLGGMADELLLASQRVLPARLLALSWSWQRTSPAEVLADPAR
ncbi:MAG: TIGR01777 family oxidoreductase [Planctomycetota bacterium]|nr:TIGR01777 family oxidoreductase [Planctomycetota bacterium]MCX8040316.1 TIGR01777 family oxidoreductase [Planctomycetota bacterium]MDW8373374.1 TIGR01777 family oxidoreductase [Planctomycetota bacterium]